MKRFQSAEEFVSGTERVEGRRAGYHKGRVSIGVQGHPCCAGVMIGDALNEVRRQAELGHLPDGSRSAFVDADSRDQRDRVPETVERGGEIERGSAEEFLLVKDVPENFS